MIEARVRVIYGDTDQMGVVYYANYLRYFEFARSEFLRAIGGTYRELEREGAFLPVVEAICRYKAPARYDDLLVIRTEIAELRRVSLTFAYELRRENDDAVLCTGSTTHACVGRNGQPTRIPDNFSRLLKTVPGATMARGALTQ
jgi:acyl-CoA thioester hydrolase